MSKNILVLDDDEDTLKSIKRIFKHQGYNVITAKDGFSCIDKLEKGFTGILLMDLMMPKMDGWDTIREIIKRDLQNNVEIFVITAIGSFHHEKMKGLESYIKDYIAKPFDVEKLVNRIYSIN